MCPPHLKLWLYIYIYIYIVFGGMSGVIFPEMEMETMVQTQDKVVCISHSANTLGKGMNSTILSSTIGK